MDRFIGQAEEWKNRAEKCLKSNMDRFIDAICSKVARCTMV